MIIGQSIIIILSLAGLVISYYIHYNKRPGKQLVCIIGEKSCDNVVNSKYNKLFGINNEKIGMVYYGFVALIYISALFFPVFKAPNIIFALTIITGGAALFSIYLILIQIFKLKEYCEWCIASALISLIIFIIFIF